MMTRLTTAILYLFLAVFTVLVSTVIVVTRVSAGSPAEAAGLAPDARIVAVDGRPAAEMDAGALRAMLTSPVGHEVVLTLGDGATVRLVARDFY